MYNKNDHLAKWSIFVRYSMSSFAYTNPFPPRPKTPFTYVIYWYSDIKLSKGHLGSRGGEASKNKLKGASFIFSTINVTILSIFRTHAHKEYRKVLEMKGTYILDILDLLLLENLQRIYTNSRLNGTQSKDVK